MDEIDLLQSSPTHGLSVSESELPFQTLANSIPQLSWIADETGHIFWYNQRWYEFTGTTAEEMVGWGWKKVHHPDYVDAVVERWSAALKERKPWEDTFPLLGKDGQYSWFLSRATPVCDETGRVVRWFGTNTDITHERQISVALDQSRARAAAILESALDCIIVIDHESRVCEWNPAAEKTFGYSREEAMGRRLDELIIPPSLSAAHLEGLQRYVRTGHARILGQRVEVPALHADGHEFPIELAVTRIEGAEPAAFSAYLRDISVRKSAEANLAAHARLANLSAEIGLALNKSDSLRSILQACTLALTENLDAAAAHIWTLNDLENVLELEACFGLDDIIDGLGSRIAVGELKIGLIAQRRVPLISNQVVEDGAVDDPEWAEREGLVSFAGYPLIVEGLLVGVMGVFARHPLSDDTARALATVADALALGVKRKRAEAELERARAAAEEASLTKSLFLATMSHELRTPLNAILGYSEMLEEEANENGLQNFASDLGNINAAGKHLLALINDILDLSKIEAGRMELWVEDFDLLDLIEDVANTARPLFEKNSNRFELEIEDGVGMLRGDATKVRQCLFNLLSNAAKFTQNGEVVLAVRREAISDGIGEPALDWIVCEVRDSGIGMSSDQVLRLFQAFTQADASTTRKFGGTGLGLALTRRFCQMMGGDVTVQSTPDVGSVFTLKLMANVDEIPDRAAAIVTDQQGENASFMVEPVDLGIFASGNAVLVIDDDATQREMMRRYLSKEGLRVETAGSGEEGLRRARQLRPAAITLDVMMAGMDGWNVLRTLKSDEELSAIPVIMLTMVDDKKRGYALGAADYLTKPVERARLTQILKKYLCPDPPCPILVVDDDEVTRQGLRAMLEREGWGVTEAANGRDALLRVEENRPHLIVLDLMMPEMDGFDFAAALQQSEEFRAIPIVVFTAKDLSRAEFMLFEGNVQKTLRKPLQSREQLLQQVRNLVTECVVSPKPSLCGEK